MEKTDFLALLDELFELDAGTIKAEDCLKDVPGWGSLTFVGLIALIDEECGVALPPKVILNCQSVGDLFDQVQQRMLGEKAAA